MGKRLGTKDIKFIELQREAGKSLKDIAEALTSEGYVNRVGKPLQPNDVSYFVRMQGTAAGSPAGVRTSKSTMRDVEELMSSNLSSKLKERFLRILMGQV